MITEKILYKILRYLLQATILYLILRFTPYIKLEQTKAIAVTILIMILCICLEFLYLQIYDKYLRSNDDEQKTESSTQPTPEDKILEKFDSKNCDSCSIEKFEVKSKGKCRVVCDGQETTQTEPIQPAEQIQPANPTPEPTNINQKPELTKESTSEIVNEQVHQEKLPSVRPGQARRPRYRNPNQEDDDVQPEIEDVPEEAPANDDRYYWGSRYGQLGYDTRYGFGGMFYDENPTYNRFRNNDYKYSYNRGTNVPVSKTDREQTIKSDERYQKFVDEVEKEAYSTKKIKPNEPWQEPGTKSQRKKSIEYDRRIDGDLDDDLPYTDYNHLPVAAGYKSHDYEYGYSFLPPES